MSSQFDQALRQADALVTQGRFDEALALYEQLAGLDPENVGLYQQIAQLAERKGDLARAIHAYMRWAGICASHGHDDDALRLYGQILAMEGGADKKGPFKGAGSAERVRELMARYRPEISVRMGRILVQRDQADDAIRFLKVALDAPEGAQDARVHLLLGQAYMAKNMDKEAIGEFQEVVRLAPNDSAFAYEHLGHIFLRSNKPHQSTIVWFRNAGDLYLRNEQWAEAIRAYEMIMSLEQRNKDVLNRLGDIYLKQGMLQEALAAYHSLAQIYTEEGLVDKVILLYEKLVEINPDDAATAEKLLDIYRGILLRDGSNLSVRLKLIRFYENKGDVVAAIPERLALTASYFEKGILDEALVQIQRILELDPRHVKAREMLGDLYLRREESESALQEYLEVLRLYREAGDEQMCLAFSSKLKQVFPQEGEVHYQLAHSLKEQGALEEALSESQKVLHQNPDHVPTMCDAGEIYMATGRLDEARGMFIRVLELAPDRSDVRLRLFECYLKVGDVEHATEQVQYLAAMLAEQGLYREAEVLCRRLLAYCPDSADIRLQICHLRLAQGDLESVLREYLLLANMFTRRKVLERAAEMYGRILQYRPDNLNAHYRLGRVMAWQGQTPQALAHFGHLAEEYLKRNLVSQALSVLGESVDLDPDNVELRQRLVDLLVRQLRIEEATAHYKHLIRMHLVAGNLEEVGRRVKEVISLQPLHLDLRLELATMYLEYNHLEQGQGLLEELVSAYLQKKQTARVIGIYAKMAQVYHMQGRWDLYWQVRERSAELHQQEGRSDEAITEYQEILEGALKAGQLERARGIFPVLADIYIAQERASDGVRAFERMVELFSRDGNVREAGAAQDFLIQLLERSGEKQMALDLLEHMAQRALADGDPALALGSYTRMVEQLLALGESEKAVDVQFKRVQLELGLGNRDGARSVYSEIRKLRGDAAAETRRFAELLYENEFVDDALPLFIEIVERKADDADARARLAAIHARRGDIAQAARMARALLASGLLDRILSEIRSSRKFRDDEGGMLLELASFFEEMGFPEEALMRLQEAAKVAESRLEALNRMAFLFKRSGFPDLAVRQFVRTLEQPGYDDEELLETRYNLAQLYFDLQRHLEALSMFNECSAIKLRYRDVSERIEELTKVMAAGGGRAAAVPFSGRKSNAPPAATPPEVAEVAASPAVEAAVVEEAAVEEAVAVEPCAEPAVVPTPESTSEASLSPAPEGSSNFGDDDFFLEGPPPDPTAG